jgi:hypothetical protein
MPDNNEAGTEYLQHTLDAGNTYGNLENTMEIIRNAKKGKFLHWP